MKNSIVKFYFVVGILISTLCLFAVSANAETIDSGTCGENLTWELDDSGTLTISGTGDMDDYSSLPWNSHKHMISSVVINDGVTSIGMAAFEYCRGLTSVTIPDSVTSIGSYAFSGCTGLTSVTIPDSVTSIGSSAFRSCTGLTSITISDGVTSIGSSAFDGCTGLTSITILDSVTSIGSSAFLDCTNLTTIYWNAINVSSYPSSYCPFENAGTEGDGLSVIFGEGVETIPAYAFSRCKELTNVTIPDGVTEIGRDAFYGCTGLTNITIPDSVTSIDYSAFSGCTGLTSVIIPDGVMSIGQYAFRNCANLTSVTIPDGVTSIGSSAFSGCTGLKTVYWDAINVSSYPSSYCPFENAGTEGDGLSVIFGESVETIPAYAFSRCKELTNVTIPDGVTEIGRDAFYGCTGLTSITIPDGVTEIGRDAFYGCTGLTNITIPDSVTSIDDSAFSGCTGLTSVTIPDGVTNIGESAFSGCVSLSDISISGNNTKYISQGGVVYNKEKNEIIIFPAGKTGEYRIPDSVKFISASAFSGCTGLTSITIPDSVRSIGQYAFSHCTGLTSVIIPDSVTSIDRYAFYGCTGLTSVTIPDSVTTIGSSAFSGCTGLTSVTIPDSVTSIGDYAFSGCTGLTSVTIPDSVTTIGSSAFSRCTGLTSVTIPDSVTSIGDYAFSGCTGLTSVTIPDSVTSIGSSAFGNCANLTKVNWNAVNVSNYFLYGPFHNSGTGGDSLVVVFGDGVETIPEYAFYGCKGLTSVTIPDSVTTIGSSAFSGCTGLHSVIIPKGVVSIEDSTFAGCTSLTDVTVPSGVTSIGYSAFSGCTNLESIYFLGTLQQWKNITVGSYNSSLIDAKVYCLGGEYQVEFKISNNKLISYMGDETDLIIPSMIYGVTIRGIAYDVFSNSPQIRSITIPHTVTYIDEKFGNLINLEGITVDEENTYYSSIDGVLFNKDQTILIAYPPAKQGEYIIPDTVEKISAYAFENVTGLTKITIPENVSIIQDYAFVNCPNLEQIYWNATNVQDNHTSSDMDWINVYFDNIGKLSGGCEVIFGEAVENIPEYAFYKCTGINKVTISAGVDSIGYRALQYCEDLESITVSADNDTYASHNGVLYNKDLTAIIQCPSGKSGDYIIHDNTIIIGENDFAGCDRLDSITISENVKIIARWAFYGCKDGLKINWNLRGNLGDDDFHLENGYSKTNDWFNKPTEIVFSDNVKNIPEYFFMRCNNVNKISFGSGLESVGYCAFYECADLTDVYYNGRKQDWEKITINKENNPLLDAKIHCLDGIYEYQYTAKEKFTFSNGEITGCLCDDEIIIIPPEIENIPVTAIGDEAFRGCTNIKSMIIPDGVTSIGNHAFSGCTSLAEIIIPDRVTSIGEHAFLNCNKLNNVTLPNGITEIAMYTFLGCSGLTDVTIPDSITKINNDAFKGCSSLMEVIIPNSVTSIGGSAFEGCTGLTSIDIPNNVKHIGSRAFSECTKLSDVTISNGMSTISRSLFESCKSLTNVTIPEGVVAVESFAFAKCDNLKTVTIPNTMKTIDEKAFLECVGLTDVYYVGTVNKWRMISIDEENDELLNANIHYSIIGEVKVIEKFAEDISIVSSVSSGVLTLTMEQLSDEVNIKELLIYVAEYENGEKFKGLSPVTVDYQGNIATFSIVLPKNIYKIMIWDKNLCPITYGIK